MQGQLTAATRVVQAEQVVKATMPQPHLVPPDTVRGLFIQGWQQLYAPDGSVDVARLKARLAAHRPGVRTAENPDSMQASHIPMLLCACVCST